MKRCGKHVSAAISNLKEFNLFFLSIFLPRTHVQARAVVLLLLSLLLSLSS